MTDVKDAKEPTADAVAADVTKKKRKKWGKGRARTKWFEIGRICQINFGPYAGKICVILDFVDSTRCLIDGPKCRTGVPRQTIPFGRLAVTKIRIKVLRACRTGLVRKEFDRQKVAEKWAANNWAKKAARAKRRRELTDLERFKVMCLRMKKGKLIKDHIQRLYSWRKLARKYQKGATDKKDQLLAAKRCLLGMMPYRNIKKLKYDTEYDLTTPLGKNDFNKLKYVTNIGKGFQPWKRVGGNGKKSKKKLRERDAYRKALRIKRLQTSRKLTRQQLLDKLPKKKYNMKMRRAKLARIFKGKTHEEILLIKRNYRRIKKWNLHKMYRVKAKKKRTLEIKHLTLMKKQRIAAAEKRRARREKAMEKHPHFKKKVMKRRETRKKKRLEIQGKKKAEKQAELQKHVFGRRKKRAAVRAAKEATKGAKKPAKSKSGKKSKAQKK